MKYQGKTPIRYRVLSAEFAAAFLAAQKEMPTISKGRTATITTSTGSYSYSYADLGDVLAAALPILHEHGLAISQPCVSEDERIGVATRLYHESGYVEEFGTLLLSAGGTPQSAGSALTYARRYAACAALGIVADEDTDGASQPAPDPAELARLATNKLKAEVVELVGKDRAPELWKQTVERFGLGPDDVVSLDQQDAVRAELKTNAEVATPEEEKPF